MADPASSEQVLVNLVINRRDAIAERRDSARSGGEAGGRGRRAWKRGLYFLTGRPFLSDGRRPPECVGMTPRPSPTLRAVLHDQAGRPGTGLGSPPSTHRPASSKAEIWAESAPAPGRPVSVLLASRRGQAGSHLPGSCPWFRAAVAAGPRSGRGGEPRSGHWSSPRWSGRLSGDGRASPAEAVA